MNGAEAPALACRGRYKLLVDAITDYVIYADLGTASELRLPVAEAIPDGKQEEPFVPPQFPDKIRALCVFAVNDDPFVLMNTVMQ